MLDDARCCVDFIGRSEHPSDFHPEPGRTFHPLFDFCVFRFIGFFHILLQERFDLLLSSTTKVSDGEGCMFSWRDLVPYECKVQGDLR